MAKNIGRFEQIKFQIINKIIMSTLNHIIIVQTLCVF